MKERPIIFSGPMVRAILDGRKTQTRRLVKPALSIPYWHYLQPMFGCSPDGTKFGDPRHWREVGPDYPDGDEDDRRCPVTVGDRLWAKEAWRGVIMKPYDPCSVNVVIVYGDDTRAEVSFPHGYYEWLSAHPPVGGKLRSPLFMPRRLSRITLEVTGVRAQRLQEISDEDVRAEGFDSRAELAKAWDELNGNRAPWAGGPWVWPLSFRRVA